MLICMYVYTYIWICIGRDFRVGASPDPEAKSTVPRPVSNILYGLKSNSIFLCCKEIFFYKVQFQPRHVSKTSKTWKQFRGVCCERARKRGDGCIRSTQTYCDVTKTLHRRRNRGTCSDPQAGVQVDMMHRWSASSMICCPESRDVHQRLSAVVCMYECDPRRATSKPRAFEA
jgi:hypothetical protein